MKSNSTLLSPKKIASCGFCSISNHRTTGIDTEITEARLIEYLQNNFHLKSLIQNKKVMFIVNTS